MGEYVFNKVSRRAMLNSFDDAAIALGDAVEARLIEEPTLTWNTIDPTCCGVLRLPDVLIAVVHDEEPVAALGHMNGRVASTEYSVGEPELHIQVPVGHPRSFVPWLSLWRGEQLFGVAVEFVSRVLYPGDVLTFGKGDIYLKGWADRGR